MRIYNTSVFYLVFLGGNAAYMVSENTDCDKSNYKIYKRPLECHIHFIIVWIYVLSIPYRWLWFSCFIDGTILTGDFLFLPYKIFG